jgi:diguanylate cyclase (GGDEF)-like protein
MEVAERVRRAIEEYPFTLKVVNPGEVLTVSLGVAVKQKDDKKTIPGLIHEADVALYKSKTMGKNRVTGYSAELTMPGPEVETEHRKP